VSFQKPRADFHCAAYWSDLTATLPDDTPKYNEILFLANLVIQNPINWWVRRAVRKTVCTLIKKNPRACINQILISGSDASRDLAWRGLLCDKAIMKCFRSHVGTEQYARLLALKDAYSKRR
jgi:hypothetical protein